TRDQIGAQRQLHQQQRIEAAATQSLAQLQHATPAAALVIRNELDAVDVADQARLELAGDPGDGGARPVPLDRAHHGHDMADITQRGKTQDAQGIGWGDHACAQALVRLAQPSRESCLRVSVAEHRHREGRGEVLLSAAAVDAYTPQWFARQPGDDRGGLQGGRGNVRVIGSGIGPLVHRGYRRGGLPRHFIRDRYLWLGAERTRSFREFRLMQRLHRSGLPVPAPIAARYRRSGLTYSADLLTRLVPDARPLVELLAEANTEVAGLLQRQVAPVLAALHNHQVWHADLNAHNILVDASGQVWLLDFDRAREGVTARPRLARNLDRLLRSL